MSCNISISVKNLAKGYKLYNSPGDRLRDLFGFKNKKENYIWAIKNISFEVYKGEMFGIIGRNGSGKSTLLQILAGIFKQTEGELIVNGKVGALLELGSGFNLEFTGRENIYLNAAVLGLKKEEIEERISEIIDFSEIGDYIDRPVKTYSSGMFVRLAFSVAVSVDADIMLIDEALAVGDVFFRQKCYDRLRQMREKGVTVILVSHAMGEIEQFCDRTLVLKNGKLHYLGNSTEAVEHYYLIEQENKNINSYKQRQTMSKKETNKVTFIEKRTDDIIWPKANALLQLENKSQVTNGLARCTAIAVCDKEGIPCKTFKQNDLVYFYYEFEVYEDIGMPIGGIVLYNDKKVIVHGKNSVQTGTAVPQKITGNTKIRFLQTIELNVQEGDYTFEVGFSTMNYSDYLLKDKMLYEELNSKMVRICVLPKAGMFSVLRGNSENSWELRFHGLCDLSGNIKFVI